MERELVLNDLKDIVSTVVKGTNAKVYLFGSWARGQERRSSDIDLAIEHYGRLSLSELRTIIAESNVPYNVDVVDLDAAGECIISKVRKEGILWIG